jgi:hypothetical protein
MTLTRFRSWFMSLFGLRYRELPPGIRREDIESVLSELHAEKCGEFGTPAGEITNEYFRIGRRKVRLCIEDELFFSLWGSKTVVDRVYTRVTESWESRKPAAH